MTIQTAASSISEAQKLADFIYSTDNGPVRDTFYRAKSMKLGQNTGAKLLNHKPTRMTLELTEKLIISDPYPIYTGLEYLSGSLNIKVRTHKPRKGKNITIVDARYVGQFGVHKIIAYPEIQDLEKIHSITRKHSERLGPSMLFPGSLGVLNFRCSNGIAQVDYLQSSIDYKNWLKNSEDPKEITKEYRRAYASWMSCLVLRFFEKADSLGAHTIKTFDFPNSNSDAKNEDKERKGIFKSLYESHKLEAIAIKFNYRITEISENSIFFEKIKISP